MVSGGSIENGYIKRGQSNTESPLQLALTKKKKKIKLGVGIAYIFLDNKAAWKQPETLEGTQSDEKQSCSFMPFAHSIK